MRYALRYRARHGYPGAVPFGQHMVRLLPGDGGGQTVESASLRFTPEPIERVASRDFFGNRCEWVVFDRPHSILDLQLEARLTVKRPLPPALESTPAWEGVRERARRVADLAPRSPVHFLFASPRVSTAERFQTWAQPCFAPGRPLLAAAMDLAHRIHDEFEYAPGATAADTRADQAFAARRGVCQDFSHVMIACLRALGLPAAYASGFLRTIPPPGQPRLEGADAMHAWVRVWLGDALGWIGIDPTNATLVGDDHIDVAVGRDYTDVSPIDGVVVSAGDQTLAVAADVIPLD